MEVKLYLWIRLEMSPPGVYEGAMGRPHAVLRQVEEHQLSFISLTKSSVMDPLNFGSEEILTSLDELVLFEVLVLLLLDVLEVTEINLQAEFWEILVQRCLNLTELVVEVLAKRIKMSFLDIGV